MPSLTKVLRSLEVVWSETTEHSWPRIRGQSVTGLIDLLGVRGDMQGDG